MRETIGVMHMQVKELQGLTATIRLKEKTRKDSLLQDSEGTWPSQPHDVGILI